MELRLQIDKGQTALADKGLPAEGWHAAEVRRIEPSKLGGYARLIFVVTSGNSEGLEISEVLGSPKVGESQDMSLRRIRMLRILGLIDDDAEGDVAIDLDAALNRPVEIDVVHATDNGRTFANLSFVGVRRAA